MAVWQRPHDPAHVEHVQHPLPPTASVLDGVRLVQVSDLHIGRLCRAEQWARHIAAIRALSIQRAPRTAHGGGGNAQGTLDAVANGISELNERGAFGLERQEAVRHAVETMPAATEAARSGE